MTASTTVPEEFRSGSASGRSRAARAADSVGARIGRAVGRLDPLLTPRRISMVAAALSTGGFVLAVLAYASVNAYSSDDVAVQNIVRSLVEGDRFAPIVGGDNFAVKVPLYLLVGAALPNGTAALTSTVLLCNAPLVVALLLVTHRATAHQGRLTLAGAHLLVAWFLVSRIATASALMIPNGRNGEIGIVVLVVWWWSLPYRSRSGLLVRAVGVPVLAAVFFSDGFFLYVLGPAALLTALVAWAARLPYAGRAAASAAGVVAAALVAAVLSRIATAAGMVVLQNYSNRIPAVSDVPGYLGASIGAVLRNLNGDAVGAPLTSAIAPSAAQVLLGAVLSVMVVVLVRSGRLVRDLWTMSAATMLVISVALYIATSNAADAGSFRYMLFGTVLLILLAVSGVAETGAATLRDGRPARLVAAAGVASLVLGIGLNAGAVAKAITGAPTDPQSRTREIVRIAERRGLAVGFGQYWDANVSTYFSNGRVTVVPQDCSSGRMLAQPWLVNQPVMARSAPRTFVVLQTSLGCTAEVVRKSFGAPTERVPLTGSDDAVWIYDRSLG